MSNPPPPPSIPPVPSVPPVGGNPIPPVPPVPTAVPSAIPTPPPPAGVAPTMPLPVAPASGQLGGGIQLGGGLKTVALPAGQAKGFATPGAPTAQLPKATIALTPTQPIRSSAPVSSVNAAAFNTHPLEEEEPEDKTVLTLSIIALALALILCFMQAVTIDGLEGRVLPGWIFSSTK